MRPQILCAEWCDVDPVRGAFELSCGSIEAEDQFDRPCAKRSVSVGEADGRYKDSGLST